MGKKWRIRVSIPVPPACKAGALPLELIPQSDSQVYVTPIKENGILRFLRNELSLSKLLIKLRVFKCIIEKFVLSQKKLLDCSDLPQPCSHYWAGE